MPASLLIDDGRVDRLRAQIPGITRHAYLNTGTAGPMPRVVRDAIAAEADRELEDGRIQPGQEQHHAAVQERARTLTAEILGVSGDEIALTSSTGEGINVVLHGLQWQPGDEVVTTGTEHDSALLPLAVLRQRQHVTVRFAQVGPDDESTIAAVTALLGPRTRLLALSHVSYATGTVLPLRRLVAVAHERGIAVLADGAQAFAALPLDLRATGVDFYAAPGQKWLCGPEGTGALFVRRDALSLLSSTFIGYASVVARDIEGNYLPHAGARRFEVGTRYLPAIAGHAAALEWWRDEVGASWAYARIHELAARLIAGLSAIPGVEVVTPAAAHAGLVSFRLAAAPSADVVQCLTHDHGVLCRSIPWTSWTRLSTGWYNTVDEIDRVLSAIAAMRADA